MTTAEKLDFDKAERRVVNGMLIRTTLLRDREGLLDALEGYREFAAGFEGYRLSDLRKNP